MSDVRLELLDRTLHEFISRVHRLTGITMGVHKRNMLHGRLSKRIRELGLDSFEAYLERLDRDDSERQAFINAVTTNETHFFRTPQIWEYVEREYLPRFFSENPRKKARFWSAAASSGQEAYSLAMLCLEFKSKNPGFSFEIYASDISTEVLAVAEAGVYQGRAIEELHSKFPARLKQHFSPLDNGDYRVKPQLKASVRFGVQSLFQPDIRIGMFDLVLLRNVMIYFSDRDLQAVLANVSERICSGGGLVVGESESLSRFQVPFDFVQPLVYRKTGEVKAA